MLRGTDRGFAMIYVACIVFLLAAAGIALLAQYAIMEGSDTRNTATLLERIYQGVVGDPSNGNFGYLGDVGDYPASLKDLIERPSSNPAGWNGPYLVDVPYDATTGWILDYSSSPIEYFLSDTFASTSGDSIALISRGVDHSSTNTLGNVDPNLWSNFTGVAPTSATYTSGNADNADNVVTPDVSGSGTSSLLYYPTGSLSVSLTNNDSATATLRRACPGLYNVLVSSRNRGPADGVTVRFGDPNVLDLMQGVWTIQVVDSQTGYTFVKDEGMTMMSGASTRTLRVFPDVNSSTTPTASLRVQNNDAANKVNLFINGVNVKTIGTSTLYASTRGTCSYAELRNSTTGAVVDSWVVPYGTNSTRVYSPTTYDLTVVNTGASYRQIGVLSNIPGTTIGTVYQKHAQTFRIPSGTTVTITGSNGTTVLGSPFVVSSNLTRVY